MSNTQNIFHLHGKIGDNEGIVFIRNKYDINESTIWHVKLDEKEPNNPYKSKAISQIR